MAVGGRDSGAPSATTKNSLGGKAVTDSEASARGSHASSTVTRSAARTSTSSSSGGKSGVGGRVNTEVPNETVTGGTGQVGGSTESNERTGSGGSGGSATRSDSSGLGGSSQTETSTVACGPLVSEQRLIAFGTLLDPAAVLCTAQQLARSVVDPSSPQWRAKGDQHRKYHFQDANADEPYRLYVPTKWDGKSNLPLAMFLHGSGSDENTYVEMNNQQLLKLAEQHGYLLVSPLGDKGAYGNFLRLSSPFGKPDEAAKLMAQVTDDSERTNQLSERDVIQVLELVLAEYPIDRTSMFLLGHSMGSGGTWYIGGKYASYWRGIAPLSGPFVQEAGYPWDSLHELSLFVTEGTQTPSLEGSRQLRDWLTQSGFNAEYKEVDADHGGMIPLVLPDIFDFFDRVRGN